jgi:mycothiol synthase|tara:strand:- start:173 stop:1252 length:1080 start_codon:yes stop_codon:yes gene_type:complete
VNESTAPAPIPENATPSDARPLSERVGAPETVDEIQHPDVATWRPATRADLDEMVALVDSCDRVDHPTWLTPREDVEEIFELSHIDPELHTRLGFAADGELVAMAGILVHPSQDKHVYVYCTGMVHPRWRRRGIGTQVLRWEYETAQTELARTDARLPGAIFLHAYEHDAEARALGARRGMPEERWFTTMLRDLSDPIPEVPLDAGSPALRIETFGPQWRDATRVARNDAFRDHWGSLETPPERWERFVSGSQFRDDLSRVVVDGDRVVAMALATVNEDDWEVQGYTSAYVALIGVVRDYRGRRLAPAVITALLTAARDAGLEKVNLDVDTESPTGANSLYGRLGFEATDREVAMVARF